MTRGTRAVVSLILGFVLYRVAVEGMDHGPAILIGVLLAVAVWLVSGRFAAPAAAVDEDEELDEPADR